MDRLSVSLSMCVFVIILSACTSFLPGSPHQPDFPLSECASDHLQAAREHALSGQEDSQISYRSTCVTPQEAVFPADGDGAQASLFSSSEREMREVLERPYLDAIGIASHPKLGVALSGGGTKASAFATGVLAGMADHGLLDQTDFISSVSGGGYAAYFYYAHKVFPRVGGKPGSVPAASYLYRDCVRTPTSELLTSELNKKFEALERIFCDSSGLLFRGKELGSQSPEDNKYQAFQKCMQDLLSPINCSNQATTEDWAPKVPLAWAFAQSVAAAPIFHLFNTLFDEGVGVSPAKQSYMRGIGLAYGSTPEANFVFPGGAAEEKQPIHCTGYGGSYNIISDCRYSENGMLQPRSFSFEQLRVALLQAKQADARLPYWIINATATKYRSARGWFSSRVDDNIKDVFEMTPLIHGSARYGYVSSSPYLHGMNVLDAVVGAAAFFDANEQVFDQPVHAVTGVVPHTLNLSWGLDIRNYNVSDGRSAFHRSMPFLFYWIDGALSTWSSTSKEDEDRHRSSFIRLVDGGSGENLGAYSLLRRGVRNLVISDGAQDTTGFFADVCHLVSGVAYEPSPVFPRHIYFPGLKDLQQHCADMLAGKNTNWGYRLHDWQFSQPVLFGCARVRAMSGNGENCNDLEKHDVRLFLVKPALDYNAFKQNQRVGANKAGERNDRAGLLSRCWLSGDPIENTAGAPLLSCEVALHLMNADAPAKHRCPTFPQNSTVSMTGNSSSRLFAAYRELSRQYVGMVAPLIAQFLRDDQDPHARDQYQAILRQQEKQHRSLFEIQGTMFGKYHTGCDL